MNIKVNQITDDQLLKCMKDFLDNPTRYHPEYLGLLIGDYQRRAIERLQLQQGPDRPIPDVIRRLANIETSKDL